MWVVACGKTSSFSLSLSNNHSKTYLVKKASISDVSIKLRSLRERGGGGGREIEERGTEREEKGREKVKKEEKGCNYIF